MQRLIAHRGNFEGVNKELENSPSYIKKAIDNYFDVEIDIWHKHDGFWLGHDSPQYRTSLDFLAEYNRSLWLHCKNIEALSFLKDSFNCFYHNTDDVTLTSKNYIWTYPNKHLTIGSIALVFENSIYTTEQLSICYGICSDNFKTYN
jgi:hypothetical protein